ncbi:hypothetical protein U9M48_007849 [Paspalum notatum var. saurae]|uniref:Membrane-associated kinase regulator 6 n=1 Tax=Paspalum notatum var. saurae TaxID=547442 RepID=A0AAQ3SNC0_PASNO
MEASPSRSDSFSHGGWPRCDKPRPARSLEQERLDANAALGESFSSSTASFIDMDPEDEELFSMRWTSDAAAAGFDFGPPPCAAGACSPLLASAGLVFSDDSLLITPCEPISGIAGIASAGSSPAFHTARSTPASSVAGGSSRRPGACGGGAKTMLATRRLLLRYLRFLAPLCRKARAFSAPRCRAAAATPARRSTSSSAASSAAVEHWCHGNADTAVRDAILHCKKSLATARAER